MTATVIDIDYVGQPGHQKVIFRVAEPKGIPGASGFLELQCDIGDTPFSTLATYDPAIDGSLDIVQQVGEELHDHLSENQAIDFALTQSISAAANGGGEVRFALPSAPGEAENIPWEALYHPQGQFLALMDNLKFTRVADNFRADADAARVFYRTLRVVAVLAATGIGAKSEWDSLWHGLSAWKGDLSLTVILCESTLKQHIEGLGDDRIKTNFVPDTEEALQELIFTEAPHILHCFCHGSSRDGSFLQIANRLAYNAGGEPLYINAQTLANTVSSAWLVIVNACSGAEAGRDSNSFANALVNNGIPAVVGMRERVTPNTLSTFTRAVYRDVVKFLEVELTKGLGTKKTLDWGGVVSSGRMAICNMADGPPNESAPRFKEWTLPVIYVASSLPEVFIASPELSLDEDEVLLIYSEVTTLERARELVSAELQGTVDAKIEELWMRLSPSSTEG